MKKILITILILISIKGLAQFPVNQTLGSPSTLVYGRGGLGSDSGFVYRTNFSDTTAANLGFLDAIPGITIRVGNTLWMRNTTATAWVQIGNQDLSGYELLANKATDFSIINNTKYPTTQAVSNYLSGYQPLDADLTALAALSGTNTIYYRSAANTWSAVTIGSNLSFSGGTLSATGGATPSLEQVTDVNPETNNQIHSYGGFSVIDPNGNDETAFLQIETVGSTYGGALRLRSPGGNNVTLLAPLSIASSKTLRFPGVTGTLAEAVTVNGTTYHSDANGIIDIGTISGGSVVHQNLANTALLADGDYTHWWNSNRLKIVGFDQLDFQSDTISNGNFGLSDWKTSKGVYLYANKSATAGAYMGPKDSVVISEAFNATSLSNQIIYPDSIVLKQAGKRILIPNTVDGDSLTARSQFDELTTATRTDSSVVIWDSTNNRYTHIAKSSFATGGSSGTDRFDSIQTLASIADLETATGNIAIINKRTWTFYDSSGIRKARRLAEDSLISFEEEEPPPGEYGDYLVYVKAWLGTNTSALMEDQSDNGFDATQATSGKQATFTTNVRNSKPAWISSDGGNAYELPPLTGSDGNYTIGFFVEPTASTVAHLIFEHAAEGGGDPTNYLILGIGSTTDMYSETTSGAASLTLPPIDKPVLVTYVVSSTSGQSKIYYDGREIVSPVPMPQVTMENAIRVFNRMAEDAGWIGRIYGFFIKSGAMTLNEIVQEAGKFEDEDLAMGYWSTGTVEENDPNRYHPGTFSNTGADVNYSGVDDNAKHSTTPNDYFEQRFYGTGVELWSAYFRDVDYDLYIDGVFHSNITRASGGSGTIKQGEITGLTEGYHILKVVKKAGAAYILSDKIVILP